MKELKLGLAAVLLIVGVLVTYNSYQEAEKRELKRELYTECLRLTEELLKANPDRITTPYCSGLL